MQKVKKILLKNLYKGNFDWTALGAIRIYDLNGNLVETIDETNPNDIIKNDLTYFETSKVIVKSSSTYNSSYCNVGNIVRTDYIEIYYQYDITNGNFAYWSATSSDDPQWIEIELKDGYELNGISQISINITPSMKYTDRGIGQNFVIEFYDENDNLIGSKEINVSQYDLSQRNLIIDISFSEIFGYDIYLLLAQKLKDENDNVISENIFKIDLDNMTVSKLEGITIDDLTDDETFKQYATKILNGYIKFPYEQFIELIGQENIKNSEIYLLSLIYSKQENMYLDNSIAKLEVIFKPELLIQKEPIEFQNVSSIKNIEILGENLENIKIALSRDLINWYSYNLTNNSWEKIKEGNLSPYDEDIQLISKKGISAKDFNNIVGSNQEILNSFFTSQHIPYPDILYFAILLDTSNVNDLSKIPKIKNIILNVISNISYQLLPNDPTKFEIYQDINSIIIKFKENGEYIINYLDKNPADYFEEDNFLIIDGGFVS